MMMRTLQYESVHLYYNPSLRGVQHGLPLRESYVFLLLHIMQGVRVGSYRVEHDTDES